MPMGWTFSHYTHKYCFIARDQLLSGVLFTAIMCWDCFMQQYSRDYSGITRDLYWTDHFYPVMLVKNSSTWITLLLCKNDPVIKMYDILLSDIKRQMRSFPLLTNITFSPKLLGSMAPLRELLIKKMQLNYGLLP